VSPPSWPNLQLTTTERGRKLGYTSHTHSEIVHPKYQAGTFTMESTTHIKFENSPADSLADSFVSTPGTAYPPLFNDDNMSPMDAMTPRSYNDDDHFRDSMDPSVAGTPAPEKKPVKKRKSWGQQLPEPKTNLPPRKRAKTEDEKEQRRVERVLRNRRAAQSSRERKRQEVEKLEAEKNAVERRARDLELRLADMEAKNAMLTAQLEQISGGNASVFNTPAAASSPVAELRQSTPVTFTTTIFGQQETESRPISTQSLPQTPVKTVNPASLSPDLRPVAESSNANSSDLTQHPAAMLCDLQCQSEDPRPWMDSTSTMAFKVLITALWVTMSSAVFSTITSPLAQIVNSLKTGSPLSPTNSLLNLIIWLTTTKATLTSPSMTSSTTTTSLHPRFSLRICLLRRLLACSPNLARPLKDATMVAMRLASEQQLSGCFSSADASCRELRDSPSVEALMTLLWAIHVIEKEREQSTLPKLDAAKEEEQTREFAFRPTIRSREREISLVKHGKGPMMGSGRSKKSLGDWRPAFGRPHGR
jgi:transcriptional activator HAC1